MTDTKVFITRKMAQEAIDMLIAEGYQVEVWEDELPPSREVMLEKAKECDALLTLVTDKVDDELMVGARGAGFSAQFVGDCNAPRGMAAAIHEGHQAGITI